MKTISTFYKTDGGDVMAELYKSISFLQTTYCFPPESEFYTVANLISPTSDYVEFHIYYHDSDSYLKWYELFGEIVEELVTEFIKELAELNIEYARYLPVDCPIQLENTLPLENFTSKFIEKDGNIVWND